MANSIIRDVKNARKCENINDPIDTYVVDYIAMVFQNCSSNCISFPTP